MRTSEKQFYISEDQRNQIVLSTGPVTIETIMMRIRKQQNRTDRHLKKSEILKWLDAWGMIEKKRYDGMSYYGATADGRKLGIGDYMHPLSGEAPFCLYGINAQAYIIANLEKIASFSEEANRFEQSM